MQLLLKQLRLQQFKGVTDATYDFKQVTKILGANGSGKTTIATAWYWLTTDKDYALKSNPNILPVNAEECLPRVEAVIDICGKEITIAKQQKITKSKPDCDGVIKTTLANQYEINSEPKTERDFRAYLEDEGIDWSLFLALSHTGAFMSQKACEMRKILFEMGSDKSDFEIAGMNKNTSDVAALLEQYKFEEIEAMHKASKKKAEVQVKSIPDQIIGLEKAKVDIDTAELELEKNCLQEQISGKQKLLDDNQNILDEYQKSTDGIMALKFEISSIEREAMDKLETRRNIYQKTVDNATRAFREAMQQHSMLEMDIQKYTDLVKRYTKERADLGVKYENVSVSEFDEAAWVFDGSATVCPMCGREYEADAVESIKLEFEVNKQKAIDEFNADKKHKMQELIDAGKKLKQKEVETAEKIAELESQLEEAKAKKIKANKEKIDAQKKLTQIPSVPDLSDNQVYEQKQLELSTKEKALESMNCGSSYRGILKTEIEALYSRLEEVNAQISKASNNVDIDEQISELQKKQREYEQSKADSEKILYQLDLLSKRKNELLVEEINQHFSIIKWVLFDYQKNGGYKEVCIPTVDGKRFGESTNTGREIIAKLDICNSLQKYFGMNLPVFLDNAESINDFNLPKLDCQLITLNVTEDSELKVEVE